MDAFLPFNVIKRTNSAISVMLWLISFAILIFSGTSCRWYKPSQEKKCLRVLIEGYPSDLDPRRARDAYSVRIDGLLYRALFKLDRNLEPVPDMARKVEVRENGTRYVISLKRGMKTWNGCPLTADDVVYTYRWHLNPQNASPARSLLRNLKEVKKLGRLKIEFLLDKPYAPFIRMALTLFIVPSPERCGWNDDGESLPPPDGAYVLERAEKGAFLTLRRNENFRPSTVRPECVTFKVVESDVARVLYLLKSEADYAQNAVPPDYIDYLKKKGLHVIVRPGTTFSYLAFNLREEHLMNVSVRRAIAYAINRGDIVKFLLHGYADVADSIFPSFHKLYPRKGLPHYSYDPVYARKLLDEAGYPLQGRFRFVLEYKTSLSKLRVRIARMIKKYLEDVGIGVRIKQLEWGTLFSDVNSGNFHMYSMDWVGLVDGDVLFYLFHSSSVPPQGANRVQYLNEEVDTLLETARFTLDPAERIRLYRKALLNIARDLPYFPLWHWKSVLIVTRRVKGAMPHPLGDYMNFEGVRLQ